MKKLMKIGLQGRSPVWPEKKIRTRCITTVFACLAILPVDAKEPEVICRDTFDTETLQTGWSWLREHEGFWRLKDPGLDIRVEPGTAVSVKNALLRDAPDRRQGRYAIEVTVRNHTVPIQQYEQAGIIWYKDGNPVFKFVKELVNGQLVMIPGAKPMAAESVRLKVIVDASSWTALYQPNAQGAFLKAATGHLPSPGNDQVSIQCYNGPTNDEHWIRFDDFKITKLR